MAKLSMSSKVSCPQRFGRPYAKFLSFTGHPYEPLLAVSGIDHTIKIFSPDARSQDDARKGINLGIKNPEPARYTRLSSARRRRPRDTDAEETDTVVTARAADDDDDDDEFEDQRANAANPENVQLNGGLTSRKRMHNSYQICSRNDTDRQMGIRDAFITVCLLGGQFPGFSLSP